MRAHYQVLDGLRGTAAIAVVIFHIFELIVPPQGNPFPHGYLAVDFFYALSGFVIGYAYDARLGRNAPAKQRLSFGGFVKRRLIRLHPMVPVAVSLGLICYLNDPNVGDSQTVGVGLSLGMLLTAYLLTLFLLPSPTVPNHWDETHAIDAPTWTLFWEYIANVVYVLWLYRLRRWLHIVLLIASALALLYAAAHCKGGLGWGWGYDTLWVAPIRLAYPFLAGLLIYRLGWKIRVPQPYIVASIVVLAVLAAPVFDAFNGYYEALAVIFVFPLALMIGAGIGEVQGRTGPVCRFTGELSYPLYIVHYPFVFLYGHWVWNTHPADTPKYALAAGVFAFVMVLATVLLYAYDKPLRAWLAKKYIAA